MSDSISHILRIGKALLIGFMKTLWQKYKASELTHREDLPVEEDSPDDVQVISLQECMLRILQDLQSNAEIASMAESISGENSLEALADVAEHMFAKEINWGRIVVFFYFSYKVFAQSSANLFNNVVDLAMAILSKRLAKWIQKEGGWDFSCVINSYDAGDLGSNPHLPLEVTQLQKEMSMLSYLPSSG